MHVTSDAAAEQVPTGPFPGRALWLQGTIAAACVATTLDAALLQQKKSFFTGGFLAANHASTAPEAAAFIAASLLVDASLIGLVALALLWATARLRLTRQARLLLVVGGALAPLVIWNFINYSLLSYLGDAFDLELMFDLTGRKVSEMLAVASPHLVLPALLSVGAVSGVGAAVWAVNRLGNRASREKGRVSRGTAVTAVGLFVAGFLAAAVAGATSDTVEDGLRRKPVGNTYTRLTAAITDFDGDGYGIGGRTSDPAPFNGAIYPYALDIPGNGIDENGVGGDLPSAEPAYVERAAGASPWRHRPTVVLIVLESFRADAVGRAVNGRPVTPVLDALAREGVSSARAFSHNGYTVESRYHLFTGSLAGLRQDGTILDDFKANGYETAYFSAQDESFGGPDAGVGFERADVSYDATRDRDRRYSTFTTAGSLAVSHRTLQERLGAYLASRDGSRPLFLYLNFHDTHFPYHHGDIEPLLSSTPLPQRQIAPSRRDALFEMYLNTAANVDRAVGTALDAVTRAVGGPPAVIVTADHGESLFDEGFLGHGYAINDVQTRIPLIVRGLPMEIREPFGQADLRDAIGLALARDDGDTSAADRQRPGQDCLPVPGEHPQAAANRVSRWRAARHLRLPRQSCDHGGRRPRSPGRAAGLRRRAVPCARALLGADDAREGGRWRASHRVAGGFSGGCSWRSSCWPCWRPGRWRTPGRPWS
jgi:hypothetical protein